MTASFGLSRPAAGRVAPDGHVPVTALVVATTVLVAFVGAVGYWTAPRPLALVVLLLVVACVGAIVRPVLGVYLLIGLSLVGDATTTPWWPFTKNLSSRESIFFVSDGLSVTPLEILAATTLVAFVARGIAEPTRRLRRGALGVPLAVFAAFVVFGFARGVLSGGDRTVAVFEVRPLVYLPLVYFLAVNLLVTKVQFRLAFTIAMLAVGVQSLFAISFWQRLSHAERSMRESLNEHTAAVTMNALCVVLIGLAVFGGRRWVRRSALALTVPVACSYVLSQRRAAMVALFGGLVVLGGVLWLRDRRRFWRVAPAVVVFGTMFVAATWNVQGGLGLPAASVKSVFFPDSLGAADRSSDLYRQIEAYNLWVTIRSSPVTGFGFGHRFVVAARMPDISFFEYWQYLPHNAVLWVWIKTGFFGFAAMLFAFGRSIQLGARAARRALGAEDAVLVVAALTYVFMFVVFAWVDIAWDARPAVMLALSMAIISQYVDAPRGARPGATPATVRPRLAAAGARR